MPQPTAHWITLPQAAPPVVAEFALTLDTPFDGTIRVSADERFVLLADGEVVARGPGRGTPRRWPERAVRLEGVRELRAVVWSLGDLAPLAQHAVRPGFVVRGEDVSTGLAGWRVRELHGHTFEPSPLPGGEYAGPLQHTDLRAEHGPWVEPAEVEPAMTNGLARWGEARGHALVTSALPPQVERDWPGQRVLHVDDCPAGEAFEASLPTEDWQRVIDGGSLTVPAGTRRRVLIDLGDYVCGYDDTTAAGDGTLAITWAENLRPSDLSGEVRGRRDVVRGSTCRGRRQVLTLDEKPRRHSPLWWTSGRYRLVEVDAVGRITIDRLGVTETRFPLEMRSTQRVTGVDEIVRLSFQTLQACGHETYVDCPYYEQLQYVGDTRVQALVSYACCGEDQLARESIASIGHSIENGLVPARHPSRVRQVIPQFALFWVAMLHDFLMWRAADDERRAFVREHLPAARAIIETFLARRTGDGLVDWPAGWDWVDWVPGWPDGQPPGPGINAWQLVYVLRLAAELERWADEHALADRIDAARVDLAAATDRVFWNDDAGGWGARRGGGVLTEHAQAYSILSGSADPEKCRLAGRLLDADAADVVRGSLYFRHYVFEALHTLDRGAEVLDRLGEWHAMAGAGLCTTPEKADPTRSDCHAWSAHPLLHLHTTLAGVRPAAPGFASAHVRPVADVHTVTMHPLGRIEVRAGGGSADWSLPAGVERAGEITRS